MGELQCWESQTSESSLCAGKGGGSCCASGHLVQHWEILVGYGKVLAGGGRVLLGNALAEMERLTPTSASTALDILSMS